MTMRTIALIATAILLLSAVAALAHENYSKLTDPVYSNGCCGGSDCAPLPTDWVREVPGGYRLDLSLEQAMRINPNAKSGIGATVPYARVIPSFDADFHLCIFGADRQSPRNGVLCLIVPVVT
jgi:hypothetical protein